MAQITHFTTDEAEIALQQIKLIALERGTKLTNKVDLLNYSVVTLAKVLKQLDEESINQLIN